jgi:hypothetical protein
MKLNVGAIAAASSLLWGGAVLCVGVANSMKPDYGNEFLGMVSSIYPGYKAKPTPEQIAVGTGYALLDGAVGGAMFAALYNCFACGCRCCHSSEELDQKAA